MKTFLITGSTGVIGSALLPFYLGREEISVKLLIRGDSEEHIQQRLKDLLDFTEVPPGSVRTGSLEVFAGDVTQPRLGLADSVYRKLTGQVTHVVHCAANVNLTLSKEEAQKIGIGSAQHLVQLARDCQASGQFQKLDSISTVGVSGRLQGNIPEEPINTPRSFRNTYESTKAEAEDYLLSEAQAGLPLTLHRPSMVVGNSQTGKILRFQVFYYLCRFLTGIPTRGWTPNLKKATLDIVPVDYVAKAIQIASEDEQTAGRIFHHCSGPESVLNVLELMEQVRESAQKQGMQLPPLHTVSPAFFRALLPVLGLMAPRELRRNVGHLKLFLEYLNQIQIFENRHSKAYFIAKGHAVPSPQDYLEKVLDYSRALG